MQSRQSSAGQFPYCKTPKSRLCFCKALPAKLYESSRLVNLTWFIRCFCGYRATVSEIHSQDQRVQRADSTSCMPKAQFYFCQMQAPQLSQAGREDALEALAQGSNQAQACHICRSSPLLSLHHSTPTPSTPSHRLETKAVAIG